MSAIFGIWNLDSKRIDEDHVSVMKSSLTHYGKDEQDILVDGSIAMGCCINNISNLPEDIRPIYIDQANKCLLISDAQIYNRDELIYEHKLSKDKLISNNGLIMEAYKKWGIDCPKYINGDFTFVIWDAEKKTLVVVRDHLGVRPLYYYYDGTNFVFATDYRAILTLPFIEKEVDELMLYKLLSNNEQLEVYDTYFKNIKKVPQSNLFTITDKGISRYKYWTPGSGKKLSYKTEEEYFNELYSLVSKAIKIRLDSTNHKIGAEMSGGLDSSVITVLANRELRKKHKALQLFSWAPSFEKFQRQARDERNLIELICEEEKLECLYYDLDKNLNHSELDMKRLLSRLYSLNVLNQELELMSSKNIRIMLTGWGGDQGVSHRTNLFGLFIARYWSCFFKEVYKASNGSLVRFIKIAISSTVFQAFKNLKWWAESTKGKGNIISEDFYKLIKKKCKRKLNYFNINPIKHLESGNIQTRTEATASIGAEYGIQFLFPLLDYNVVDFAMSIPRHMYYKNGINRYIFRKTFEGILPKEVCFYVPKDDVARLTYLNSKSKNYDVEVEIINNLDKNMFSKYINFNKILEEISSINEDGNLKRNKIKMQLNVCYYIQEIIKQSTNGKR